MIAKASSQMPTQMARVIGVLANLVWKFLSLRVSETSPTELITAMAAIVRKSAYAIRLRTRDERLHKAAEALNEHWWVMRWDRLTYGK